MSLIPSKKNKKLILNEINFNIVDLYKAIELVRNAATMKKGIPVRFVNAWSIVLASENPVYLAALQVDGFIFCDGKPVSLALKYLKNEKKVKYIRGPKFFSEFLKNEQNRNLKHLFIGSTDKVLSDLVKKAKTNVPDIKISGTWSPHFLEVDEKIVLEVKRFIDSQEADIVWLGLGTPKQDLLAAKLTQCINLPVICVGAAFDFYSGNKREAPIILQKLALEWMFRLILEPKRLWKRYLFGNIKFIRIMFLK